MPGMLASALAYAAIGWPVFPSHGTVDGRCTCGEADCPKPGKHPVFKKGFHAATTDSGQIQKWWGTNPAYNIATSPSAEAGMWALDADDGGDATLAKLEAEHGKLPAGPMATTPSGGSHYVFAWPADGLPLKRHVRFLEGLDALAEGGGMHLAPSVTPKGEYRWIVEPSGELPQAPDWLLAAIRADTRKRPENLPRVAPVQSEATTPYGRRTLDVLCDELAGAPVGQQEYTLSRVATRVGSVAAGGSIEWNEAFSSVVAAAMRMTTGDPHNPWQQREVETKVRQAMDKAAKDPSPPPAPRLAVDNTKAAGKAPKAASAPVKAKASVPALNGAAETPHDDPPPQERMDVLPFRVLGYDHEFYFYISNGKQQVTSLKANDHTPLRLLQLANLNQWNDFIGTRGKISDEQWRQIANSLIQGCHTAGIFKEEKIRGRGAWVDKGRVIVHTGNAARVSGETLALGEVKSSYVYEAAEPWEFTYDDPAKNQEAFQLVNICNRLTWTEKLSAALLVGWCVIAPVCGALPWRPHIWVTGPSGSGKTTVVNDIIGRVVGPCARRFDGDTSEAGIRQTMGYDALPVLLDEAESEDQAAVQRIQGVLKLARVSSSGGSLTKGGQTHKAVTFIVRSCFMFSSINTALRHQADESRVSRLMLRKNADPEADAHYLGIMRDIEKHLTPAFSSAMFARTVRHLPTLLHNAKVFTSAAATAFHNRRAADQVGPMLAGFYLCHRTDEISFEAAAKFIAEHQWQEHLALDSMTDDRRLFQHLMTRSLRFSVAGFSKEMSVGEVVEFTVDEPQASKEYAAALGRKGIRVDMDQIAIANNSPGIRELLRDTPWAADWKGPLSNIPGSVKSDRALYFSPGVVSRAVLIPLAMLRA